MKRRTYMLSIIVLGALAQQALPGFALLGGIKPPVLASMAVHHALRKGSPDLWMAVFFAAVLQDGLELGSFGPALLAFPLAGLAAYRIRNEIFLDGLVTQLAGGAFLGLFTAFVTLLIYSATGQRTVPPGLALVRMLGAILLGMVTLPVVSRSINWLESLIPKPREYGWQ
jgi:rod shape-determining protein MreD